MSERPARLRRFPSATPAAALAGRGAAIVLALVLTGLVLAAGGRSPFDLAVQVVRSTLLSEFGREDLCLLISPLIMTGVTVAITQTIGIWNIGGEGQFYAGAFAATAVGLFVSGPPVLVLPAMALAGIAGGMLWILVPTLARAYAEVNELITPLLLNFVATLLVYYVSTGPWRDRVTHAQASTARIPYDLPLLWGEVHWGLVLAIAIALLLALLLAFTRWGYEVRMSGANPQAARYAGIPVRRRIIAAMLLSGGIAGLAGMVEVAGTVHRLQGGISNNFGYIGIMVAVMARGSCLGVIASAALMALILNAGIVLQTQGVTTSTVLAITGLILFLTAIGDELAHYRRIGTARKS
jgi:general nucleoside transport system permease protein